MPELSPCSPTGWTPKVRRHSPTPQALGQYSHIFTCTDPEANEPATPTLTRDTSTDVIGHLLGDFGLWQLRTMLIVFLCKIPAAWFMASILFTAPDLYPEEEYSCDTSPLEGADNSSVSVDQCYVMVSHGDSGYAMHRCHQFHYSPLSFHSLVMEFDLACLSDIFVAWSQYWHLFGFFMGGVVATKLLPVLSPRQIYVTGIWSLLGCGLLTVLVNDFSLHCALRCLAAIACSFMVAAGEAIFSDITAGKHRVAALLLYDTFWALGLILLPGMASFAHSWRHIYLEISLPLLVIIFLLPWTPDSPRWVLQHTKDSQTAIDGTVELVLEAARINGHWFHVPKDLPHQLELLRERLLSQSSPVCWLDLWRGHSRSTIHMVAVHLALAAFLVVHVGLLLNIRAFGREHLLLNTMAMGLAEILGCFSALYLTFHHNLRKWQWAGGFCIFGGCIGCLCWFFNGVDMPEAYEISLWLFLSTLPKVAVSCGQSMILACLGELVPPEHRTQLAFSAHTWARVWQLSASLLILLREVSIAFSLTSFCTLVILGGLCTCCLVTPQQEQALKKGQQRAGNGCHNLIL
ncbi:solute carrier family 22 member 1 [Drosophila madeirensis]|uniref:Solute carrier family 22 member 1 n=1 Tax=Drosophila madeirensis TaxID=30013 RepID=A0AAU9F4V3_DROMD